MATVELEKVSKTYPNGTSAVRELDLRIGEGEFVVLVGPSGCGKTTALRMVAGLEEISSGILRIGGAPANDVSPQDRNVAMVFQNYALYPHMTVRDNIGFALRLRHVPKEQINQRVREAARILDLTDWLDRKPGQLSGGQRQRVAMGRAIVREPSVFLMDEPLSNLDARLRVQMRAEILRIQRRVGVATLYVTHDQTEAMTMGDRVVVLRKGILQQVDAPQVLYDNPTNLFVAAFIGSPSMNLFTVPVLDGGGRQVLRFGSQEVILPDGYVGDRSPLRPFLGRQLVVGVRPEDVSAVNGHPPDANLSRLRGRVELVEATGAELIAHLAVDAEPASTAEMRDVVDDVVDPARSGLTTATGELIARFEPRTRVRVGEDVDVTFDPHRLHFFDPTSGLTVTKGL